MSIRIVTHCYAGTLPQYAVFLRYQLSSLILHKPKVPIVISVCFSVTDNRTIAVLSEFLDKHAGDINIQCEGMTERELFRRAIGRNRVALKSAEDLVWFTDVDYLFRNGCLDNLWAVWKSMESPKPTLIYPKMVMVQRTHQLGDALVESAKFKRDLLVDVDEAEFVEKPEWKAIGGIQIVDGAYARIVGYLNTHSRYQQPVVAGQPFPEFRDDVKFRSNCAKVGAIQPIDGTGVYRLRHSRTTYQPDK